MNPSKDDVARKRYIYRIPREYRSKRKKKRKSCTVKKSGKKRMKKELEGEELKNKKLERKKLESSGQDSSSSLQSDSTASSSKRETSVIETKVMHESIISESDEESNLNQESTLKTGQDVNFLDTISSNFLPSICNRLLKLANLLMIQSYCVLGKFKKYTSTDSSSEDDDKTSDLNFLEMETLSKFKKLLLRKKDAELVKLVRKINKIVVESYSERKALTGSSKKERISLKNTKADLVKLLSSFGSIMNEPSTSRDLLANKIDRKLVGSLACVLTTVNTLIEPRLINTSTESQVSTLQQPTTSENLQLEPIDLELIKSLAFILSKISTPIDPPLINTSTDSQVSTLNQPTTSSVVPNLIASPPRNTSTLNKPSSIRDVAIQSIDFEIVKPFITASSAITFADNASSSNVSTGKTISKTSSPLPEHDDISTFDEFFPELDSIQPDEEFKPDEDMI